MAFFGNIDFCGYSPTLGGYLLGGWIDLSWNDPVDDPAITFIGETGVATGVAILSLFPRDDVKKRGFGLVLYFAAAEARNGALRSIVLNSGGKDYSLVPSKSFQIFDEARVFQLARQSLTNANPNEARARLHRILDRPHYQGVNTLSTLSWPVHVEIDKVYFCPPRGFVLRGWFLDPFAEVARIRLLCGPSQCHLDPKTWIRVKRPDVAKAFADQYGLDNDLVGFIAYAAEIHEPGESFYLEVVMRDGQTAFRPLQPSFLSGIQAIKELLGSFRLQSGALVSGYDHVVGPAVEAMNAFRLRFRPEETVMNFGAPTPATPRASIIIPLYGRIDFLEYQLAFFSKSLALDHEIIYVLDDPERRVESEALAASSFERFQRPFTLVALSHNVGYAPANNIGLKYARGAHVCFLNSDVFPHNPDWLECMIETEQNNPSVGIVGALLHYEDGTLQHRGCTFKRLPEFGNWPFAMHPDKGRRISIWDASEVAVAVTGACMVVSRDLALRLGGFDEGYVIGDFEDTDLCLRSRELGLSCIVDHRADLYHLERQSQGEGKPWRMNLSLYNAWRFQRRWRDYHF